MKKFVLILLCMVSLGAFAQEKKGKNAKADVEVNGNCDQCKRRIEKAAFGVPGVKSAVWHIDDHKLHLIYDDKKTSVDKVKAAVAKAGHDAEDVKATQKDYDGLHHCCKYERT